MNLTLTIPLLFIFSLFAQQQTIDDSPQLTLYSCSDTHPDQTFIQLQLYFYTIKKQLSSALQLSHQKVKSIHSINSQLVNVSADRSRIRKITNKDKKHKQKDKLKYKVKTQLNITIPQSTLESTIKNLIDLKVEVKRMETVHKYTMKKSKETVEKAINATIQDAVRICNEMVINLKDVHVIEVIEGLPFFDSIDERDPSKSICTEISFACVEDEDAS